MTAVANSGDSAWLLAAAAMALLAVLPGFALVAAGRLGAGLAARAASGALVVAAAVSLGWALIGYSLAFGPGGALIGGLGNAMLAGFAPVLEPFAVPESAFALYQMVLAMIALAVVTGASAGRAGIGWLGGFALLWSVFAFAPIARAMTGGGVLADFGAIDFAGGASVHVAGGTSALVVALILGRSEPPRDAMPGLSLLGAGLVWVGSLGVAGGASYAAGEDAGFAMLNIHVAAAAALVLWGALSRSHEGLANAVMAGLAASAAGAGFVGAGGAAALGAVGALVAFLGTRLLGASRTGGAVDALAVHGAAGAAGLLLTPLFMLGSLGGLGLPEGASVIGLVVGQAIAVLAVALWAALATAIAAFMAAAVLPMRAPEPATHD